MIDHPTLENHHLQKQPNHYQAHIERHFIEQQTVCSTFYLCQDRKTHQNNYHQHQHLWVAKLVDNLYLLISVAVQQTYYHNFIFKLTKKHEQILQMYDK